MMMSNKDVKPNTHTWSSSAVSVELKMNIKKLVDRIVSTRTNLPKRLARGSSWYLIRHLNFLHFHDRVSRMLMDDCVQYCRSQWYVVKLQKPRARVRGEYFDVESNASWLSNSRFEKKIAIKTQKLSNVEIKLPIFFPANTKYSWGASGGGLVEAGLPGYLLLCCWPCSANQITGLSQADQSEQSWCH